MPAFVESSRVGRVAQPPCGSPTDDVTPHSVAACLNAGDAGSNPGAGGMNSPPLLGNVGSGKFGTP
jgi:hypothetical protein